MRSLRAPPGGSPRTRREQHRRDLGVEREVDLGGVLLAAVELLDNEGVLERDDLPPLRDGALGALDGIREFLLGAVEGDGVGFEHVAAYFIGAPMKTQALPCALTYSPTDSGLPENGQMEKPDLHQAFVRNLGKWKKARGYTQQVLADRAGLSQAAISELLRGISQPSFGTLGDLAHALGIDAWELIVDSKSSRRALIEKLVTAEDPPEDHDPEPTPRRGRRTKKPE